MARGDAPENRVVFEPTGPYHRAIERALGASGVPFVKVSPRQARRFAEATGKLEKTDRLDAAILTRMGALLEWRSLTIAQPDMASAPARRLAAIPNFNALFSPVSITRREGTVSYCGRGRRRRQLADLADDRVGEVVRRHVGLLEHVGDLSRGPVHRGRDLRRMTINAPRCKA